MENRLTIQDVPINNLTQKEFFGIFHNYHLKSDKRVIFFANAHVINVARKDQEFSSILQKADLVLADGMGIRIAGKLLGNPVQENLNGTDLMPKILEYAEKNHMSVFLLGAEEGITQNAAIQIKTSFPKLKIVGHHHGYLNQTINEKVLTQINSLSPDILLVGMGNPLQEKWIHHHSKLLNTKFFFGVGAYFDFVSGKFPRAPSLYRRLGMEWIYRLWQEPSRLMSRYLAGIPVFLYRIVGQYFWGPK